MSICQCLSTCLAAQGITDTELHESATSSAIKHHQVTVKGF
jgi:hypothetical protein